MKTLRITWKGGNKKQKMMSKKGIVLLTFVLMCMSAIAQPRGDRSERHERIEALKVGYITEQLNLDSKQAKGFWPVYNSYENERRALRKSFYEKYKDENPTADRRAARDYIEANLDYQEQDLDIKKTYKEKLLKVITPEQLAALYKAERGFKQMLIKELRERRGGRQ